MEFRDLKRQYEAMRGEMEEAIGRVVSGGVYIGGKEVEELEKELAEYVGVKHCVTCGNGTDALKIGLKVWGIGEGDAVFVPDFTFFATAEVVAEVGATPVFVDVDERTYNMSAEDLKVKVERCVKEGKLRPKVVIPVDLFGLPADYSNIFMVCMEYGLRVLEDGAQGFGGSINEKRACSFGEIGTTSFFPAKPLGCYGDGGALFMDNDEWAEMARSLKVHGKGKSKYENVRIGMNSRLDAIQAAVLGVKLRRFDWEMERVNWVADMYNEGLKDVVERPYIPEGYVSSWAQYTIRCNDRNRLQEYLKGHGIPSMVYYPIGMHKQEVFKGLRGECVVSDRLCETVLSLPMHPYLTEEEITYIIDKIKEY